MEFIEAPAFTRHISDYLDADEYRLLQNALLENPDLGGHWRISEGPLGGCETWKREERWFEGYQLSLLVRPPDLVDDHIHKDEAADLTAAEKKMIKSALGTELKARERKRTAPREIQKRRAR